MSGGSKSNFLQQLEQLAEVTSVSPRKASDSPRRVWKRPHVLYDGEVGDLQTPPRNRLPLSFLTDEILANSDVIENSPAEPSKASSSQPCVEISPSPVRNCSLLLGKNLAKNKEVGELSKQSI